MSNKEIPVSIVIRTNDQASAKIAAISARISRTFVGMGPGLAKVTAGFKGIGNEMASIARTAGVLGGAVAAAIYGIKKLGDEFDDLGDAADRVGVTADALAQLRYAARLAGSSTEELDAGMSTFVKSLGQVQAGTGKLHGFLKKVSPALLEQVKGAKSSEEAFNLLADATAALEDPQRRAALATAAFGGAGVGLAPLLSRGSKGVNELRQRFAQLAGPQGKAVEEAGRMEAAFGDLDLAGTRLKATIVTELGPSIVNLSKRATDFLVGHQAEIAAFIHNFGERLPAAFEAVGHAFAAAGSVLRPVVGVLGEAVDMVGGAENAVKLLVGAWLGFKALKLASHLGGITKGLYSMAAGAGAAAAAGNAPGGGGKGGGSRAGGLLASIPFVYAGASYVADSVLDDQERGMSRRDRGQGVAADLKRFRERGTAGSRRMLLETLRSGGFLDKGGRFAESLENNLALRSATTGRLGELAPERRTIDEINKFLAEEARNPTGADTRSAAAADRSARRAAGIGPLASEAPISGAQMGQLIESLQALAKGGAVTVDFKNVPTGTRVDRKNPSDVVDYSVGYQGRTAP